MSLERIQAAQERQIELKAKTEELKIDIEKERHEQTKISLYTERTKTNIASVNRRIKGKELLTANINYDIATIRQGAASDQRQFEKSSRLMGQHEYRAKLQIREVALNDQILNIRHNAAMSGDSAIQLISGADLTIPQLDITNSTE